MVFRDFSLSNDEVLGIINDYMPIINKYSIIKNRIDEDLKQEIILKIYTDLRKNYKENDEK